MLSLAVLDTIESLAANQSAFSTNPALFSMRDFKPYVVPGDVTNMNTFLSAAIFHGVRQMSYTQDYAASYFDFGSSAFAGGRLVKFNGTTESLIFDDNVGKGLTNIITDNTGKVFAISYKAGYHGVYERVGENSWTIRLSDTATGKLYINPTDGKYYYGQTGSPENYFLIRDGAVTSVGTTQPLGVVSITSGKPYSKAVIGEPYNAAMGCSQVNSEDYTGYAIGIWWTPTAPSALAIADDVWTAMGRTQLNPAQFVYRQLPLNNTYSLLICILPNAMENSIPAGQVFGVNIFLINKTTNKMKYIGSHPYLTRKPVANQTVQVTNWYGYTNHSKSFPFFAKLVNGYVTVYYIHETSEASTVPAFTKVIFPFNPPI